MQPHVFVVMPFGVKEAQSAIPATDNAAEKSAINISFDEVYDLSPPKDTSVFSRNNLWMINTARVEANDPKNLYAVLAWDEKPTGDGPGGTSDFAARVKQFGGRLAPIINPTKF
jgi:hypothetical protein